MNNTEFSTFTISYLENRISLVDQKASIIIALQTLLVGLVTFVFKEYALSIISTVYRHYGFIFQATSIIVGLIPIMYCLQIIRPSDWPFGQPNTKEKHINILMWFSRDQYLSFEELLKILKKNHSATFLESLTKTQHMCLQLLNLKYRYYRLAVGLTLSYVLFILGAFVIFFVLSLRAT